MSVYFKKGKGWRYDFILEGKRYSKAWFETKREAKQAEAKRKEEILNPEAGELTEEAATGMTFLDLANLKLDHVKAYNSVSHYNSYKYLAKRWVAAWGKLPCEEMTVAMVQKHLLNRRKISAHTANKDLRYLRSTFRHGIRKKFIDNDPTNGLDFFPIEKNIKYVPPLEDLEEVIDKAEPNERDYLIVIRETMARVSEINRLEWKDVNLDGRFIILYTRKKAGGHLTPRKIPMTELLHQTLSNRHAQRDPSKPWVFWHRFWSAKNQAFMEGPYGDRKKLMKRLCEKAGVTYFRFHPIRHLGASVLDSNNVPIGAIQRILGHENRKTTEIYLHSIGDMERSAMQVFEHARESHTRSHTQPVTQ